MIVNAASPASGSGARLGASVHQPVSVAPATEPSRRPSSWLYSMLTVSPSTCRYVSPYAPLSQCPASSRAVAGAPATVGNVVAAGAVGPGGVTLEAEPGS